MVKITDQFGRVLCPRGAVGVVVAEASESTQTYSIRFIDGSELSLSRQQVSVLKHFKKDLLLGDEAGLAVPDMYEWVIYRCVVGSRAYGLDEAESDCDRRGFYLPPANVAWSLPGAPEQLENDATQECYWEIQ